ncbi:MAG TPA: lactonase family protein [Candidatus Eisenbergiella merdipullorum]|uniref:Lactonase family protein n=1 Tax=Candidatus Eisenbergiella merdipullorum TaxID=2838553 RepID=A0A9D2I9K4_9FIRM|nr:lactonase family protein [Candidatus Eisenbergiella merdipullorum]
MKGEKYQYIASCEREGGIFCYVLEESGQLSFRHSLKADRPMYLAADAGRMYALLREPFAGIEESGLVVYQTAKDGKLTKIWGPISTKGKVACHLAVDSGQVFCVNYISGNVVRMPDRIVTHHGSSVHGTRQTGPHTHFVTVTFDGYVLVTDLGLDQIFTYTKDLDLAAVASVPKGNGPRHLAFSRDKGRVYCLNELSSSISAFRYDAGKLTACGEYSTLPEDFHGESTAAAIKVYGNFVYVSNRGHDSITVYEERDGKLIWKNCYPSGGICPRDFKVEERVLIVANEISDEVTVLNRMTGQVVQKIKVSSPVCVI